MKRGAFVLFAALLAGACAEIVSDLTDWASIEVIATRRNGDPVPGARLMAYSGNRQLEFGFSDASGRFVFEELPPRGYGIRSFPPEGYMHVEGINGGPPTTAVDGIVLEEGDRARVELTYLKVGPGTIAVVVSEPDGTPIAEVLTFLYGTEGSLANDTTGASGRVVFEGVPFGARGVRVVPPIGYTDEGERGEFRDGIIVDEGSETSLTFLFETCTGRVAVRVLDGSGDGVPGFTVTLYTSGLELARIETDADGLADFGPQPCAHVGVALVHTPGWIFEAGRGTGFIDGIVIGNWSDQSLTFRVERCFGAIGVSVVDQDGAPVPDAGLRLYDTRSVFTEAATDGAGERRFDDVPCGHYGVRVSPPSGYGVEEGRGSSFIDGIVLGADGQIREITFTLTRSRP